MGFRLRRSAPRQSRPSPTSTVEPQPSASSPSSPQRRSPRRPRIALWRVLAVHPPPLTLEQVARIDLSQLTAKSACFKRGLRSTNFFHYMCNHGHRHLSLCHFRRCSLTNNLHSEFFAISATSAGDNAWGAALEVSNNLGSTPFIDKKFVATGA